MKEQESKNIKNILVQRPGISPDILTDYVGKRVVLEIGNTGNQVSSGTLARYDGKFVELTDYAQHAPIMHQLEKDPKSVRISPDFDILSPNSIMYQRPRLVVNVNQIASIQTLEDVLRK